MDVEQPGTPLELCAVMHSSNFQGSQNLCQTQWKPRGTRAKPDILSTFPFLLHWLVQGWTQASSWNMKNKPDIPGGAKCHAANIWCQGYLEPNPTRLYLCGFALWNSTVTPWLLVMSSSI